jgi:hypothetical protein
MFGNDPLNEHEELYNERYLLFTQQLDAASIFKDCANKRNQSLKDAILYFIEKTYQLSRNL